MKFLEQNFKYLVRLIESYMGNKTKSHFYSILTVEQFLFAILFSNFAFLSKLRAQNFEKLSPKGISHTNFDSEWKNSSFEK
jgi:hypothetical protein